MKDFLKKYLKKLPFNFTKNQMYDRQTVQVIKRVCHKNSSSIDVGCFKGEILDKMILASPGGMHFAFEPIPDLFSALKNKYQHAANVKLYNLAITNKAGISRFNYVITNPSYSGIQKRDYDRKNERDTIIEVKTDTLDNIIPQDLQIDLIKIDVEGGELQVLEGATRLIHQWKPVIVFEHGKRASEYYGSTPQKIFNLFQSQGMHVSTLQNWLDNKKPFSLEDFQEQYERELNYFFIAYPQAKA